jgi:hypothetical protein
LDFLYLLDLGDRFSCDERKKIYVHLNRKKISFATNGMVIPRKSLCDFWDDALEYDNDISSIKNTSNHYNAFNDSDNIPLYYTDFSGNMEVAEVVSCEFNKMFNVSLVPTLINYNELLLGKYERNSCKIILIYPPFLHPASVLTGFISYGKDKTDFYDLYKKSLNTECMLIAKKYAKQAECLLELWKHGIIVLGQVVGCYRSRLHNHDSLQMFLPSGLLNLELFNGSICLK